mgnify:CR=1 FL=1
MYMYVLAWAPIENLICLYHTNLSDHRLDMDAFEEQIRAQAHGFCNAPLWYSLGQAICRRPIMESMMKVNKGNRGRKVV